jgi:alkylated DNA repair dioxygenase AlkB
MGDKIPLLSDDFCHYKFIDRIYSNIMMQKTLICLDKGSEMIYVADFLSERKSKEVYNSLENEISWKKEKIKLFGKEYWQPRLLAWYADKGLNYNYSGIDHEPLEWTETLLFLKNMIEEQTGYFFNSVLANLYRDGQDSMGWHSDDEKELGKAPIIASLSLGAVRRFCFRPKKGIEGTKMELLLDSGSLLIMKGETQQNFQHALPKTAKKISSRINLTFRLIV